MIKMAIGCREEIGPPDWIVKQVQWNENYSAMSSAMIPPVVYEPASLLSGCRTGRTIGRRDDGVQRRAKEFDENPLRHKSIHFILGGKGTINIGCPHYTGDTLESDKGGEIESLKECR